MKAKQSLPITAWSAHDRPREKLLHKGKESLSNSELLAIIIGSGNKEESAVRLCKRILASSDNRLNKLGKLGVKELVSFKGIGEAKAVAMIAAIELGRRRGAERLTQLVKITSSAVVFDLMQPILSELAHEEFWVIYLNNSNKVLEKEQLSKGGITGTVVDVRLILKHALQLGALGIILCHNHPSGALKPSMADKQITNKIAKASASLDIKLLDHVILTEENYLSFADEGLL
jgi:DNA repair protein RadC